jgi:hypothetical protein
MKIKTGVTFLAALLTLCALLLASNARAEDINTWAEDVWTRDKLTGETLTRTSSSALKACRSTCMPERGLVKMSTPMRVPSRFRTRGC